MDNKKEEPNTAPESDRWYNLTLGSSFKDNSDKRYCTFRYECKPASVDKTKGVLQKNKNRVTLEFNNNQVGKAKAKFEGRSEEHKECESVLFFDGETFRLERLHRAVKQLRFVRLPGEAVAATVVSPTPPAETRSSPAGKVSKPLPLDRSTNPPIPVEVERIDIGDPDIPGNKPVAKEITDHMVDEPNVSIGSPGPKNEIVDEHRDIDMEDLFGSGTPEDDIAAGDKDDTRYDINVPRNDTDDEIADVDDSGDEVEKGPSAADALRACMNAEGKDEQTSSSSSSSRSGSSRSSGSGSRSGSGSSSSSSDTDGSDEETVNSI